MKVFLPKQEQLTLFPDSPLVASFKRLESHPFGPGFPDFIKEARLLGLKTSEYRQQYQAWQQGGEL
jgi:hypothetical protein